MNLDTDLQYAYAHSVADHMFRNYDAVLKTDGVSATRARTTHACGRGPHRPPWQPASATPLYNSARPGACSPTAESE